MSDPIYSRPRPLGERILTYAYPKHEDETAVAVADVERIDAFAFAAGNPEPIWQQSYDTPSDLLSDTVSDWPVDGAGYTFTHELPFGTLASPVFQAVAGQTVKLEFWIWRTSDRGAIVLEHYVPLRATMGIGYTSPP